VKRTLAALAFFVLATSSAAEPMFVSRQYTRCTTCHFSPTGGGLLTPYGRSLSHNELSTWGKSADPNTPPREAEFLWGALGDHLGPVSVGMDFRPSHLSVNYDGGSLDQNIWMTADLLAAFRKDGWTVYGEVGREPLADGAKIDSYEYWVAHESEKGLGFRVGRFLPAYGVRFSDHTAFTRLNLGFDVYDQLYALELSHAGERHLLQLTASPGRAESILHDDGLKAFTAAGRFQWDVGARSVLVASGIYRDASRLLPENGGGGLAFGYAPVSRLSLWNQADVHFQSGTTGAPQYTLLNETAFEAWRGVWIKVSPQLQTAYADTSGGLFRLAFDTDWYPRTHFNVEITYYRDQERVHDLVTHTVLAQLHLYL
jgi:hypothetical protein